MGFVFQVNIFLETFVLETTAKAVGEEMKTYPEGVPEFLVRMT